MRGAAVVGACLAVACGITRLEDATPDGSSAMGSGGRRGSGGSEGTGGVTAAAGGGRPLSASEAACQNVTFFTAQPEPGDAGGCRYPIPPALTDPSVVRFLRAHLAGKPFDLALPRMNVPDDCELNSYEGYYYDDRTTPRVVILCSKSCADVLSDQYELVMFCGRNIGDPTM